MSSSHGRFVWYELMTTDVEAAKAFYGKVVGWGTREAPSSRYTLFTAGAGLNRRTDQSAAGREKTRRAGRSGSVISASTTWTTAVNRVKELGGTVHVPPTDVADVSRFSVVADPQMATFVLVKWSDPGRQPAD